MKQYNISTGRARHTLIPKVGTYGKVDFITFCKSIKGRKSKSRATNIIIESVLNVGSKKQQCLALNNALEDPKLINQAVDCSYFSRERERERA